MTAMLNEPRKVRCLLVTGVLLAVLAFLTPAARAMTACTIIDASASLQATAQDTVGEDAVTQVAAYRRGMIEPHPELYAYDVLGLRPGPEMDTKMVASLATARADHARGTLVPTLRALIASASSDFQRFADFRCDFSSYLTDTLGQFDGAGRMVGGRRALVFGVDVLSEEQHMISLPVLVHHELFHRYHFQAAGFSDDLADRQPLWRVLWAEGLATYVSKQLIPGASVADVLMMPHNLEQTAGPLVPTIAKDLLTHLDRINPQVYRIYFTYGNSEATRRGLPWRSGYYLGYRVAAELAKTHSLDELVHLKGNALRTEIGQTLGKFTMTAGAD